MGRANVEYNGKWACFSSICDGFITPFMDLDSYEAWRKEEYGRAGYEPLERSFKRTMKDCVHAAAMNQNHDDLIDSLLECGLSRDEIERLVRECEIENYQPERNDSGEYTCPNCGEIVSKGQAECYDDICQIRLVWYDYE